VSVNCDLVVYGLEAIPMVKKISIVVKWKLV